jgi:UPF0755 protein
MSFLGTAVKIIFRFFLILFCLSVPTAILAVFHAWMFLHLPAKPAFETRQFFIPPKTGSLTVARLLESEEVVRDARKFYLLCWFRNALHRLKAGEYAFSTMLTPDQVLDQIVNGRVVVHSATLPEGSTLWDIARIFDQKEPGSGDAIMELTKKSEFIKSLGLKAKTLEGYLFPDTYSFTRPIEPTVIVKSMVQQFWHHLPQEWQNRSQELGFSLHEIVTIASIVEKEAVVDSERSTIAGVFYNRLKIKMPLQSDPTAVYDIPGFTGPVTSVHLSRQSPYNTYYIKGLPPGPICNPGAKSLRAAFFPEKIPYLYFVSNNDGTHHFSATIEDHRKAVSHYYEQRKKAAEGQEPVPQPDKTDSTTNGTVDREIKAPEETGNKEGTTQ